jgi:hypothetical protein
MIRDGEFDNKFISFKIWEEPEDVKTGGLGWH